MAANLEVPKCHTGPVVRTGARAKALQILLFRTGLRASAASPAPRVGDLPAPAYDQVVGLFQILGGRTPMPPLRPGAWDLAFADGLVVELDEELHFNRYRAQTLQSPWATPLPWHNVYLDLCRDREQECIAAGKWGNRWTNPSCESMFGTPGAPGALEGAGAPRWKQRALYDAVKDIAGLNSRTIRLARLSVWDPVGSTRLGDALIGGAQIDLDQLRDLITRRTTSSPERTEAESSSK